MKDVFTVPAAWMVVHEPFHKYRFLENNRQYTCIQTMFGELSTRVIALKMVSGH